MFTSDILSVIKKKLSAWEKFVFSKNIIRPKWYFSYRKWNVLDTISNKNTDCRVDLWQFTLRSLHILVKNGTYFQFFMIKWYFKTSFFFQTIYLDREFFEQMEKRGTKVKCFQQGKEVFSAVWYLSVLEKWCASCQEVKEFND